jgi:hypothetical protein
MQPAIRSFDLSTSKKEYVYKDHPDQAPSLSLVFKYLKGTVGSQQPLL